MPVFNQNKEKSGFFAKIEGALIRWSPFKNKKDSFFPRHAIHFLNFSQCAGVVNDNLFKYLVVFLLINLKGVEASPIILTWVGVIYVLPFLLFSSAAGVLADRFSKQRMIVILKWTELGIMLLGIAAFSSESPWASYTLLFLLSLQSAIFSPPKYSIIPELVEPKKIPKANGLITSFTYLGIILGTFLASFLTQVTGKNFPLTAAACTLIAFLGLLPAILIPYTVAKKSTKRINPFFMYEIYSNLRHAKRVPYLLTTIFGSASFLMIGAYFQLNVIPFAVQELGMTEVAGGYLFLLTAVGIACGALLAGKASKARPEVGLSCLAGGGLVATLIAISLFPDQLILVCIGFIALGVFGGFYVVPFDSFIQRFSPDKKRGQIVAASNFLSFCGVLIAPLMLFLFSEIFHLTAAQGFLAASGLILIFILFLGKSLSCFVFSSLAKCFVKPFYNVTLDNSPLYHSQLFILNFRRPKQLYFYLLAALNPKLHLYHICPRRHFIDSLIRWFSAVDFLYAKNAQEVAAAFKKQGALDLRKKEIPCLIYPFFPISEQRKNQGALTAIQQDLECSIVAVEAQKIARKEQFTRKFFKRAKVTFHFFLK
ncbi:MAG: MFS transporter [Chlamydiota bacterium]